MSRKVLLQIPGFRVLDDPWCVILLREYDGKDQDGNPKLQERESYHANLEQACVAILQQSITPQPDIQGILDEIRAAKLEITRALNQQGP